MNMIMRTSSKRGMTLDKATVSKNQTVFFVKIGCDYSSHPKNPRDDN